MNLASVSSFFLLIAFVLYCFSFIFFILGVTTSGKQNDSNESRIATNDPRSKVGLFLAIAGLAAQLIFFFTRWIAAGHVPTSNMFEFTTFLGMMTTAAFIVVYLIYRKSILGVFAMPVALVIIAYASVFPQEIQPLIPSLQSYWLKIHVTTAAAGEAFFAIGFAAGLMYLLRTVNYRESTKANTRERVGVEATIFVVMMMLSFVVAIFFFRAVGYEAQFSREVVSIDNSGNAITSSESVSYVLPPIVMPNNSKVDQMDSFLGIQEPLFESPVWMKGVNAGRKLNTVIWTFLFALVFYGLLRLTLRKPVGEAIQPLLDGIDPEDLDEISYRTIAIGFPVFTLGALIFAMIWAAEAWGRFWGWDPKEVWALITWLFYAAYLHLRLSRGWLGRRSAWMTVIGFIIVMFTLIGVNLIIAGLHSYAGV
jgi:ABC-type transport system involved in cytochrome c biogenesis permease subunit